MKKGKKTIDTILKIVYDGIEGTKNSNKTIFFNLKLLFFVLRKEKI